MVLPFFLLQAARHGKYLSNLFERLGRLPRSLKQNSPGAIWVHAVSVGEAMAVAPLIDRLRERVGERKILVSTTTITGQQVVRERISMADGFFYYPFDWQWNVRRSLSHTLPSLVCLAETELWPNFIHEAHRRGVKLVVVNGRISQNSHRWYSRITGFLRRVLKEVDLFLMQTEEDAERIRRLGAPPDRVVVLGNLKYDMALNGPSEENGRWVRRNFMGERPSKIWIAGSTGEGEEEMVLTAFEKIRRRIPSLRLILAPRHPERFDAVASLLTTRGLSFIRRTQLSATAAPPTASILLLDTVGELSGLYGLADVAFVGGSLIKKGGHNIIEPAAAGVPVLFGPHTSNFAEMTRDFLAHDAALEVKDTDELAASTAALLEDSSRARAMGDRGRALVARSAGATARTVEKILELL